MYQNNLVQEKFSKTSTPSKVVAKSIIENRPKLLAKDNNIYTFECDSKLAMIYFAQFFSLIEILEPQELREKLQNELENTLKIYKNEEDKNV